MTEDRMREVIENTRANLELDWMSLVESQRLTARVRDLVLDLKFVHDVEPQIVSAILEVVQEQNDAVRKTVEQILLLRKALSEAE